MPLAADISNYNPHFADDITHLLALGVRRVQIGLQYPTPGGQLWYGVGPGIAHLQIPLFLAAGFEVECYAESQDITEVWHYVSGPWRLQIRRLWQACEEGFVDADYLRAAFAFMDHFGPSKRAGVYTGRWWWEPRAVALREFDDRDRWLAEYNGQRNLAVTPFDGSGRVVMHQFQGDYVLPSGDKCDLSWYEEDQVETRPLNQGETITVANIIFARLGHVLADDAGETMVEVTSGSPLPTPPGGKQFLVVVVPG